MIILFAVALIMLLLKKNKGLIMLYIFLLISIPDNGYIRSVLGLEKWGLNVNILMLFVIILALIYKIIDNIRTKKSINLNNIDILMIIFMIISIFYLVKGIFYNSLYLSQDIYYIFKFSILYFSFKFFEFKDEWKAVFKWVIICTIIYSCIYFVIFILKDTLVPKLYNDLYQQWWEGRIYFTNNSCLLFTICFALFAKQYNTLLRVCSFILASGVIILSQTRTLLFVYILIIGYFFFKTFFNKVKRLTRKYYLYISIFLFLVSATIILIPFAFSELGIKESQLWNRYFSNEVSSLSTRNITNLETMRQFNSNEIIPMLGNKLSVYSLSRETLSQYMYIDQLFITLLCKIGYIGTAIFIIFNILSIIKIILIRKHNLNYSFIITTLISLIIIGQIMNSQVIYSESVPILFLVVINCGISVEEDEIEEKV